MIRSRHLSVLMSLAWTTLANGETTTPLPVVPLTGVWSGTVTAPHAEEAIALEFLPQPQGATSFRLHFPAMSLAGAVPGLAVEPDQAGGYVIGPPFEIRLKPDGENRLSGTFGSNLLPIVLNRGGEPPRPAEEMPSREAPAPVWRYALAAGTWAPPLAADDTIFLGGGDGRFHAINAATGTPRWVWPGTVPIDGQAALDERSVYFMDTRYNLVALDRHTGAFRWRAPLHHEFLAGHSAPDNPTFNHRAATPLAWDGVIYVGSSDGGLYALNPANASVLWRHNAGSAIFSGVGLHGDDGLLFGTMDGAIVRLNRLTRRETLRIPTRGAVVTTPLVANGLLIAGSRDCNLHSFRLSDGTRPWKFSCWFSWLESSPVFSDGTLYFGSSDYARVTALNPTTGRIQWSSRVYGLSWGKPLVTDRYVFAGTVNQNIPGTLIAHRAGLVKLDRATGAIVWRLALPDAPAGKFAGYPGGPALAGDKVIVAGLDGWLAAYPIE